MTSTLIKVFLIVTVSIFAWIIIRQYATIPLPWGCPPDCGGRDIQEKNLYGYDFSQANMNNINLTRSSLVRANLSDATLAGATLYQVDLRGSNLKGANLKGANLEEARLINVNLDKADLSGANLDGANLTRVDLTGASLNGISLVGARLAGADLEGVDLNAGGMSWANLTGADMRGANLTAIFLNSASLKGVDLSYSQLVGGNLRGANLSGANLEGANLKGADLIDANLNGANMRGANLVGANLGNANLTGADMSMVNLNEAYLYEATLTGVDLQGATMVNTDLIRANLRGADLRRADLRWAHLFMIQTIDGITITYQPPGQDEFDSTIYGEMLLDTDFLDMTIEELLKRLTLREKQISLEQPVECDIETLCVHLPDKYQTMTGIDDVCKPESYCVSKEFEFVSDEDGSGTSIKNGSQDEVKINAEYLIKLLEDNNYDVTMSQEEIPKMKVLDFLMSLENLPLEKFANILGLSLISFDSDGIKTDDLTLLPTWFSLELDDIQ
jgi:uncharacterized protein YjbI with pentapeptide repeats